jgi:two-component system KDP operon response regulator KdpE
MLPQIDYEPHADLCLPVRLKLKRNLATTRGNKILVIDDDQILCLGIDIRLKANYYDPCFAHDAESALSTALTEMPDLIILDIGLPGCDGYSVMRCLNAFPELADVPVIVLTGRDGFTHERRCREAGAKRFFEKPVTNLHLMTAIQQLLG